MASSSESTPSSAVRGPAASSSSSSSLALLRDTQSRWTPPKVFDGTTLHKEFGAGSKPGGSETKLKWKCPVCATTGTNWSRVHEHALEHYQTPGILDLVQESVLLKCRDKTREALQTKIQSLRGVPAVVGKMMFPKKTEDGQSRVRAVLGSAIVKAPLPISMCEQDWPYDIFLAGMEDGAERMRLHQMERQRDAPFVLPSRQAIQVSRRTMGEVVQGQCSTIIEQGRQSMLKVARSFGCTQVSDGRSNVVNDPLIVFGSESGGAFFPQGALNAGSEKKSAAYLAKASMDVLHRDMDLASETFAIVSDGAPACLNAIQMVADQEFLVPIRCQSHALSLFLKGLATGPFKATVDKAVTIINAVRGRPRVHSILWRISRKAVFRVIEIRFATHVTASLRLLELKPSLIGVISDDEYQEYKGAQGKKVRTEMDEVESLIEDKAFWMDLKTFCSVSASAVLALRILDRSAARVKDVNPIWVALGVALGRLLGDKNLNLDDEKKLVIFKLFLKHRASAHRPVFDAAQVLNPANLEAIRKHVLQGVDEEGRAEWKRLKANTLEVLRMVVRRKALVDLRAALRSEFSKTKRQRVELSSSSEEEEEEKVTAEMLEIKFQERWNPVSKEFVEYYTGTGQYAELALENEDQWFTTDGSLKYYAIRILNMACTISDVERLHKVYSGIHTPSRNRLKDSRVDQLAMARLVLRIQETQRMTKSRVSEDDVKRFASMTLDKASKELIEWGNELAQALVAVSRTVQQPRETIEIDDVPSPRVEEENHDPSESAPETIEVEEALNSNDDDDDDLNVNGAALPELGVPPELAELASLSQPAPMPLFLMI